MHDPIDTNVSFPALEEAVLAWWHQAGIPGKALHLREGSEEYVFYEGPPTANAPPALHHVLPRAFKDIYTRYQTMRGRFVPRKAGWDCHGLPVELEVEKRLGFTRKQQILDHGIAAFNELCRASVTEHVSTYERFSERMSFWLDYEAAYWTMQNDYIESVWWSLAELHRRGLLYEGDKVTPWCPRCETPLSDHEVAQGYEEVTDPGVTVAFPLVAPAPIEGVTLDGAALAVWTTTPWTLISNLACAVGPDVTYALAESNGRRLILARDLVERVLGEDATVVATFGGSALVGLHYQPPFRYAAEALAGDPQTKGDAEAKAWRVLPAGFVNTEEGTGIVHLAAAFGADDLQVCRDAGIPTFNPVDGRGRFDARVPEFEGTFVKDADPQIVDTLRDKGLLLRSEPYVHSYPHCWRCGTPLLYYARTSWYIRTTDVRERMLEVNAETNWIPEHIRDGRYGNWLEHNVDWSLSRYRFWGTPLPIWRCTSGHDTVVESVAQLEKLTDRDLATLDLHRPHVDEIAFPCPTCAETAMRVEDLIDVWYDSGAMPFAQYHYPHEHVDLFRRRSPADFIAEAIDQTRGWFYSLMAEGVLLFDGPAYRSVVCHGHLVDEQGRKMSVSRGNILDPWEVFERFGSDPLRFYFFSAGPPGDNKRVSFDILEQVVRGPFLTLWNVYRLYVLYANIDEFHPESWPWISPNMRPAIDRWALGELHQLIAEVEEALEAFDSTRAARRVAEFIDDLSNWYVRRSRRRFWRAADDEDAREDKACAYWTLWTCLSELSKVMAPFTPFLAESMYRNLVVNVNGRAPESVHLADFPKADPHLIDPAIAAGMAAVRELVSLGRSARTDAGVKVRQPLRRAVLLVPPDMRWDVEPLLDLVADELNVQELAFAEDVGTLVRVTLKPNFETAGPEFGPKVRGLAQALADATTTAAEVAALLEEGGEVDVDLPDGDAVRVGPEHIEIRREPAEGTAFAYQAPFGVSLELEITPELRREGVVRELVHQIQNLRRDAGLEVTDRVRLWLSASGEVQDALDEHEDYLIEEVLAAEMHTAEAGAALEVGAQGVPLREVTVDGHAVRIGLAKA